MSPDTGLDVVTGAFSYSGSTIAERLLEPGTVASGRSRSTPTGHIRSRPAVESQRVPLRRSGRARPQPRRASRRCTTPSGSGSTTGQTTFANAIAEFAHAVLRRQPRRSRSASSTSASPTRRSNRRCPTSGARPLSSARWPRSVSRTRSSGRRWVFGGEQDILANNIAWILRRLPSSRCRGTARTSSSRCTSRTSHGSASSRRTRAATPSSTRLGRRRSRSRSS